MHQSHLKADISRFYHLEKTISFNQSVVCNRTLWTYDTAIRPAAKRVLKRDIKSRITALLSCHEFPVRQSRSQAKTRSRDPAAQHHHSATA